MGELPLGVRPRHIELTRQIYESSAREEHTCVIFKQRHYLDALSEDDRVQNTLAEVYRLTRDSIVGLRDLGNVVPRLETYSDPGSAGLPSSQPATNALELKPNLFGIGVNLNYVLDRWGPRLRGWRFWRKAR